MTVLNHALRAQGITASEVAKVAGVSKWGGPLEVWSRKLGLVPEQTETPDMRRGNRLEPALCDWTAEEVGLVAAECPTLQSPRNPLVIASPDRLLYTDRGLVELVAVEEVKAPRRTQHHWTDPAEDPTGIDPEYLPQVQWQMLATETNRAVVGALCYGDLWVYQILADHELQGLLLQAAERFWRDHILTRTPPPPDRGADAEVLRHLYPAEKAPLVQRPDLDPLVISWREFDSLAKAHQEEADRRKAELMAAIGEATGVEHPEAWRVTWKANKATEAVNWRGIAEEMLADGRGIAADLMARHTTIKPGARVLRFTDTSTRRKK
ncbi:MAG: YqaJ viral recombinase family protein [Anaerolineae bacterium]|jgi:putative phage-type endonuclease|nr:YqaJ viral recombinase family protein [Anaerolineae bacterium]